MYGRCKIEIQPFACIAARQTLLNILHTVERWVTSNAQLDPSALKPKISLRPRFKHNDARRGINATGISSSLATWHVTRYQVSFSNVHICQALAIATAFMSPDLFPRAMPDTVTPVYFA